MTSPQPERKRLTGRNAAIERLCSGAQEEREDRTEKGHRKIERENSERERVGSGCSGRDRRGGGGI